MKNIMLDLETLGNKPGAVIVAIGAVRFGGGQLGEEFYCRIAAKSCVDSGLKLDVDTVLWWLKQSDAARAELNKDGLNLGTALIDFRSFCDKDTKLWGNGSDFDNAILQYAYDIYPMDAPWKFYNNRCYRTLKSLKPEIKIENDGVKHNALDDAKAQARHLMAMFPEI